ncbi:MAG: DNA polymerase III subunit delta' [Magnetococcales bacterium]|nr:DNA polymerase III subunit delta' [Magnetococcales bacterium]
MKPLEAIRGQEEALQQLRSALSGERMGHAYLFYGPQGVGKGSAAKATLQSLFCRRESPAADGVSGCGVCGACRKLANASHPDVNFVGVESGKTQISVDQIRELSRVLSLTPFEGGWKGAIIDDAALMNASSANALLKTLEEPANHSLLILVTNQPGALLPTIRSRCQLVRFGTLEESELVSVLQEEAPQASAEVLQQACEIAQGSVARGLDFCLGEMPKLRARFLKELDHSTSGGLADLLDVALFWSHKDRFLTALVLLQAWFQERIRDSVFQEPKDGGAYQEGLMELSLWSDRLINRAKKFNLNRQLVLEAILIRLSRWRRTSS